MGQVFRRRLGQRVQIGESMVVVTKIDRRIVKLYVDAPRELRVRRLDAEPRPEDDSVTAPQPVLDGAENTAEQSACGSLESRRHPCVRNQQHDQEPEQNAESDLVD